MSKPVVTVLVGAEPLRGADRIAELATLRIADTATLASALPGTDILYLWDFFSGQLADLWPRATELKWVHVAATGVDKLIFPALLESEVLITNANGIFDIPIAEYVLGCILRHAKQLDVSQRDQVVRHWNTRVTKNVAGSSALIVGVGGIGRATGRLLRAAGMLVEGVGRTGRDGDEVFTTIYGSRDLAEVVGRFDYVIVCTPLTPETSGLMSDEVIRKMRQGSYLVNVGRGQVIDQSSLTTALVSGHLDGAALDTFEEEPLPANSPLWTLDSVFVSPHTSSRTTGWLDRLSDQFLTNLRLWLAGKIPPGAIDKQLGFVSRDQFAPDRT